MDLQDGLAQARESNEMICIKEEIIDDCCFNEESNKMIGIKEEVIDDCCFNDPLDVKEEVASICDDERGSSSNLTIQEGNKLSLYLTNDEETFLECIAQEETHSSSSNDVQMNNKRRKKSKLKGRLKRKSPLKTKEFVTKTGRISRDEIFKNQEYFCSLCQECFLGRKCFKRHFKVHFTICQNHYSCHICNYTTKTTSHINRHLLERHFLHNQKNNDEKFFSCSMCDRRFYDKKDLERHMFVHTGEGHFKCGECDFSCTSKCRLETHMSLIHGYKRGPRSKAMPTKYNSKFKCHYCGYSCESKTSLRTHINRHTGNKNLKCSECDYTCIQKGDLQKHCTIHSDDRPYICAWCNKSFKRRSHIIIHFNGKDSCNWGTKKNKKNSRR